MLKFDCGYSTKGLVKEKKIMSRMALALSSKL
jgi:hypothetical protein